MSLGEDFLEALRSIKRDFFRDSEPTNPNQQTAKEAATTPPSDNSAGAHSAADTPISQDFRVQDYIENRVHPEERQPKSPSSPPPSSDPRVMDAFEQATSFNTPSQPPRDTYDYGQEDNTEVDGGEVVSSSPYKEYEPSPSQQYPDYQSQPESMDARKIYDFDDEVYADERTVISRNTIIRGALQTDDAVRMMGQILGDIECKSNIVVAGKIRGNTTAANAYIVDAQIDGNMMCDDSISITNDAWIMGNLRAQQAEIDGKIKGNIETRHMVSIGSTSSIIGNISTDELEIKRGAFVNGQIIMYSPSRDVIDRFERFED